MGFSLDGSYAYVISDTEFGCFINNGFCEFMTPDQMFYLAKRLEETANDEQAKEFIKSRNEESKEEYENLQKKNHAEWKGVSKQEKVTKAYIYMLECGGRYKIGFSRNVERRISELDNRPFPVTLYAKSKELNNAYELEQYIHSKLEHLRIYGEWYEISDSGAERLKNYIERLE